MILRKPRETNAYNVSTSACRMFRLLLRNTRSLPHTQVCGEACHCDIYKWWLWLYQPTSYWAFSRWSWVLSGSKMADTTITLGQMCSISSHCSSQQSYKPFIFVRLAEGSVHFAGVSKCRLFSEDAQVNRISLLAILYYDHALTFSDEYRYIWTGTWPKQCLFLFNRYFALLAVSG